MHVSRAEYPDSIAAALARHYPRLWKHSFSGQRHPQLEAVSPMSPTPGSDGAHCAIPGKMTTRLRAPRPPSPVGPALVAACRMR